MFQAQVKEAHGGHLDAFKMFKDVSLYQTVKDIDDKLRTDIFRTLLSICHFVDEGRLHSNQLPAFRPCETHCFSHVIDNAVSRFINQAFHSYSAHSFEV